MGFIDAINAEDRIEVTKSELFDFMLARAESQFIINGLKNGVPKKYMLDMIGEKYENQNVENE